MSKIFLSYRRSDTAFAASVLHGRLAATFGRENIFFDVDTIGAGVEFREAINRAIQGSAVVLVLIGEDWLATDPSTRRSRLEDPEDYVRLEVETALRRDILVIPVLIDQTPMPPPEALPQEIRGLSYRNAAHVRAGSDLESDIESLLQELKRHVKWRGEAGAPLSDDEYDRVKLLGDGTCGRVYVAYDRCREQQVAIRIPHRAWLEARMDPQAFQSDVEAVAALHHPRIVPIYSLGEATDGRPYIVSQYIQGVDLATRMATDPPGYREAAEIVAQIADALQVAHEHGVVHRDVRPNIILLDSDGAHLADFATGLQPDDWLSGVGIAGRHGHISPEQARGVSRLDGRTDIFSLGVVLYQLLTGQVPFRGERRRDLIGQIQRAEVRPPREVDRSVPRQLERICLKALAQRPSDRYATAAEMAKELRDFCLAKPKFRGAIVGACLLLAAATGTAFFAYSDLTAPIAQWLRNAPTPAPAQLASVSLEPAFVQPGETATLRIQLDTHASANVQIKLLPRENNQLLDRVFGKHPLPATITVATGQREATWQLSTAASVMGRHEIAFDVVYAGDTKPAVLTVLGPEDLPPVLADLQLSSTITAGESVTGTVSLERPASVDTVVPIQLLLPSSTTDQVMPGIFVGGRLSRSVSIPQGKRDATFEVRTVADLVGELDAVVHAALGGTAKQVEFTIRGRPPPQIADLTLDHIQLRAGSYTRGRLTLNAAALAGGMQVSLKLSDPSVAQVFVQREPSGRITIAEGETTGYFEIRSRIDVPLNQRVTLEALASEGGASRAVTAVFTVQARQPPKPKLARLHVTPDTVTVGQRAKGYVTLDRAASEDVEIALNLQNDSRFVSLGAGGSSRSVVTIPEGEQSGGFEIRVSPATSRSQTITILARHAGDEIQTQVRVRAPLVGVEFVGRLSLFMLVDAAVQQELKLDSGQQQEVEQVLEKIREADRRSPGSRPASMDSHKAKIDAMLEAAKKDVFAILNPSQVQRMVQIQLQKDGYDALQGAALVKTMQLTRTQMVHIQRAISERDRARREILDRTRRRADKETVIKELAERTATMNRTIEAVFTDEQRLLWKKLLGKPFEVPKPYR